MTLQEKGGGKKNQSIPIIDLFAGPGGLGEGFSSYGDNRFQIALSIEKDRAAFRTLSLRSFFRQFPKGQVPKAYYDAVSNEAAGDKAKGIAWLFEQYPEEAQKVLKETMNAELGGEDYPPALIDNRIRGALKGNRPWILIGGPPCQAYSVAGRSRNKGIKGYKAENDHRHFLYREYLRIIASHWPAVFIMENVKGIISSKVGNEYVFHNILNDLRNPAAALNVRSKYKGYRIYSLVHRPVQNDVFDILDYDPHDFVIESEKYGIPQARHRVILLGIREDISGVLPEPLKEHGVCVRVSDVLTGLPRLRSGLSREVDGPSEWHQSLADAVSSRWLKSAIRTAGKEVHDLIVNTLENHHVPRLDRGGDYLNYEVDIRYRPGWYLDKKIGGVWNSSTRQHIRKDLFRYIYAAAYAKTIGRSPKLADFPADLQPEHRNASSGHFVDRFRVQLADSASSTITCHIAKDGHYYIHPDLSQCRSLTVREAARLQTFPDNYFFCGNRTEQYTQVGNAVPPLLARQIAQRVFKVLKDAGMTG